MRARGRSLGAAAAAALALGAMAGCGGVSAADLFLVTRTGPGPGQRLTLRIDEEGIAHCNGGPGRKITDPELVVARAVAEETHEQTSAHAALPALPGSVFGYSLRTEAGTMTFADNSPHLSKLLHELMALVLEVSQQVCHLPD